MSELQELITTARFGDVYARRDAVAELVQYGREAEAPLVNLLTDASDWSEQFSIFLALSKIKITSASSVDTVVSLLNLASHRWVAAKLLLHSSPNIRRHLLAIRAILERETDHMTRDVLQKLLDRYPKSAEAGASSHTCEGSRPTYLLKSCVSFPSADSL